MCFYIVYLPLARDEPWLRAFSLMLSLHESFHGYARCFSFVSQMTALPNRKVVDLELII